MQNYSRPLFTGLTCALLALTSSARQTTSVSDAIIKLERENPRVMEYLEYMTARIGHRLTGSPNNMQACEWAAQQFRSFGLEARVEQWGTFPVGFDRGPSSGGMVSPVDFEYVFATNA
jgi:carboxypeptidase Q